MKIKQWAQTTLVITLAVSLLGLPQMAAAYDGGARNNCYDEPYQRPYYRDYDRGYGYGQPPVDYRSPGYYREGYREDNYYSPGYGYPQRSPRKSAAIVGGTAAAGALFGAMAEGGKGAAIGAAIGAIGGLIFDQASKDHHRY